MNSSFCPSVRFSCRLGTALAVFGLCCAAATAYATAYTWSGNASGSWNDAANWLVDGAAATSYPGELATDDTVAFPKGDFTVTGSGDTVFTIKQITHTAGDSAEAKGAVTFKDINLCWVKAPVLADNLRLTYDNMKFGSTTGGTDARYHFNKSNIDLVLVGNVSCASVKSSPLASIGATATITVTGGGKASIEFYGTPNAGCHYTIDGSVFSPYNYVPQAGNFVFKNGGRMEVSAGWTMKDGQVNDIALRKEDLESVGAKAVMLGKGNMTMNASGAMTFNFDLKDADFGNYLIMQHLPDKGWKSNQFYVPDPAAANLGYTVNLLNADGKKAKLQLEQKFIKNVTNYGPLTNSWVRLVVESAAFVDNAWTVPPSVKPATRYLDDDPPTVSFGEPLAGEVVASTNGVTVTAEEIAAFGLGEHLVSFTVPAKENAWSGLQTNILVRVVKHENDWVEFPSVTKTRWWGRSDDTNGVARTLGEALHGDVICNYTDEQLRNLEAGRYTVRFEVPETATIAGLVTNISIFVQGADTNEVTYTWKSAVTNGRWCDPDNWECANGLLGFPSNVLVKAVVPTGVRTIDLEGCMIPLKNTADPGLTVDGQGQTIRNGGISVGRLWGGNSSYATYEDMTIDLNSSGNSAYYQIQKEATQVLRGAVSVLRGRLLAQGYHVFMTICDGETYVAGDFAFGNTADAAGYRSKKGTLTITNATLMSNQNVSFGTSGRADHTPPVLRLFDANIVCTNTSKKSGAYVYGRFNMTSTATNELILTAANKSVPRIAANYANLSNMTFVVKSAETGKYPLVSATTSLTLPNDSIEDLAIDVSALGSDYTGRLVLSADGKTLYAKVGKRGFAILVR